MVRALLLTGFGTTCVQHCRVLKTWGQAQFKFFGQDDNVR